VQAQALIHHCLEVGQLLGRLWLEQGCSDVSGRTTNRHTSSFKLLQHTLLHTCVGDQQVPAARQAPWSLLNTWILPCCGR
jgi:hypothetical protein